MIKSVLAIALLLMFGFTCSSQTFFHKKIAFDQSILFSVIPSAGGGYIGVGRTWNNSTLTSNGLVVKCSEEGEIEWATQLGYSWEHFISVAESKTGSIYVAAQGFNSAFEIQISLIKLSRAGDLICSTFLGTPTSDGVKEITFLNDSTLFLAGLFDNAPDKGLGIICDTTCALRKGIGLLSSTHDVWLESVLSTPSSIYLSGDYYDDQFLIKLTALGDTLWCKSFGAENDPENAEQLLLAADGSLVVAGVTRFAGTSKPYLTKYSSEGEILWSRYFWINALDIEGLEQTVDGNFLMLINYTDTAGPEDGMVTILTNNKGDFISSQKFEGLAANSMSKTLQNDFIVNGSSVDSSGTRFIDLIRLTKNGITDCAITTPFPITSGNYPLINNTGKYPLTITSVGSPDTLTFQVIELPPAQEVFVCESTGTVTIEDQKLFCYPNPVSSTLFFTEPADRIEIFNFSGTRVLTESERSTSVSVSTLPAGLYFIRVSFSGQVETKKVCKQ